MRRAAILVVVAAGALVGIWVVLHGSDDSSGRATNAAQRASVIASGLGPQKARDAALLALAGDRLHPTLDGEEAMLDVALDSTGVEKVLESGAEQVTAAIRVEHLIVGAGNDDVLRVWRPASGILIGEARTERPLTVIGEASGMPLAVGADATGALSLVDLSNPQHPRLLAIGSPSERSPVLALGFTQGGEEVLAVHSDGELERIGTTDRRVHRRESLLGKAGGALVCAQFESSSGSPPSAILLGLASGEVIRVSVGGRQAKVLLAADVARGRITSLAGLPYGGEVAVGTQAGLITLEDPTATPVLQGGPAVSGVAFDSEDELLVGGSEGVTRWSESGSEVGRYGRAALGLSGGSGGVLALNSDGAISLLGPISTGIGLPSFVYSPVVSFMGGGNLLLAEGWSANHIDHLEVVRPGHEEVDGSKVTDPGIRSLEPSPSWWPEGEETDGSELYVNDVTSDGEFVVVGGQDPHGEAVVLVWDARTGKPLRRLPLATGGLNPEEPSIVAEVALIRSRHLLAAYSAVQQLVAIWSTETWKLEASIPVGAVGDLALSPDESTLVAVGLPEDDESWGSGEGSSKLIMINTSAMKIEREVRSAEVDRAAFSPDGSRLALVGGDGTLRIRSTEGSEELRRPIHLEGQPLALAWRPDSTLIAVSLQNIGVVLVDPQSGARSAPLPVESSSVLGLSWSPNGRFLAAAPAGESEEGEAFAPEATEIWALSAARLERRLCQLAGGPISADEWRALVDRKLPYEPLCSSRVSVPNSPQRRESIVLGSMAFALNGLGWGRARPERIFNGGDPSGDVSVIKWRSWGGAQAIGFGQTSIFKPKGGYYPQPGRIELRAHGIGHCGLQRAYTKLSVRVAPRPGATLGRWGSWTDAQTLCGPID